MTEVEGARPRRAERERAAGLEGEPRAREDDGADRGVAQPGREPRDVDDDALARAAGAEEDRPHEQEMVPCDAPDEGVDDHARGRLRGLRDGVSAARTGRARDPGSRGRRRRGRGRRCALGGALVPLASLGAFAGRRRRGARRGVRERERGFRRGRAGRLRRGRGRLRARRGERPGARGAREGLAAGLRRRPDEDTRRALLPCLRSAVQRAQRLVGARTPGRRRERARGGLGGVRGRRRGRCVGDRCRCGRVSDLGGRRTRRVGGRRGDPRRRSAGPRGPVLRDLALRGGTRGLALAEPTPGLGKRRGHDLPHLRRARGGAGSRGRSEGRLVGARHEGRVDASVRIDLEPADDEGRVRVVDEVRERRARPAGEPGDAPLRHPAEAVVADGPPLLSPHEVRERALHLVEDAGGQHLVARRALGRLRLERAAREERRRQEQREREQREGESEPPHRRHPNR